MKFAGLSASSGSYSLKLYCLSISSKILIDFSSGFKFSKGYSIRNQLIMPFDSDTMMCFGVMTELRGTDWRSSVWLICGLVEVTWKSFFWLVQRRTRL